jgi:hypothetical protein
MMRLNEQGRRLLIWSLVLCGLAAVMYGTLRLAYGQRSAYVHVRWAPDVDATTRERVERTHNLTRGELHEGEGRTWGYYLTDLSTENIRDLVLDPAAEDTHFIHRTAFRIWRTGVTRGDYPGSRPRWIASLMEFLVRVSLLASVVVLAGALIKGGVFKR